MSQGTCTSSLSPAASLCSELELTTGHFIFWKIKYLFGVYWVISMFYTGMVEVLVSLRGWGRDWPLPAVVGSPCRSSAGAMATEEGAADGRPGLLSELEEYCFDTGGFVVIRSGAHNHRSPWVSWGLVGPWCHCRQVH